MARSPDRAPLAALILLLLCAGCESDDGVELDDAAREPIEGASDAASEAGMRDTASDAASDAAAPDDAPPLMNEASVPDASDANAPTDASAIDARVDSTAPTPVDAGPEGVGAFSAQWFWGKPAEAGTAPAARVSFTERALETRGCTSKTVAGCVVESCSNALPSTPERITAGTVTAKGSRGSCEWNVRSAEAAPPVCARQLWDPQVLGERVQLTGSGGVFPAFDVSLSVPPRLTLEQPSSAGPHARKADFRFRWSPAAGFGGLVEIWLGRAAVCASALPATTVSVRCTKSAQDSELVIPREVFAELSDQRCLAATVSARSTRAESIGRFVLNTNLSTSYEEPYLFAAPGEACTGTHAPCSTYASDEPTGCTRHGCRWQAGACTGMPHACGDVELPECNNGASGHRNCMRTIM